MSHNRILLTDDDPSLRDVLLTLLEHAGYVVTSAGDGREAMRNLASQPFDLVITDLVMPGQEGVETIFQIRRQYARLPIIAMSGGGFVDASSYLEIAKMAGADHVLKKPFELTDLLRLVEEILGGRAPDSSRKSE